MKQTNLNIILGALAGMSLVTATGVAAAPNHPMHLPKSEQFQRIEQPLSDRIVVTLGGLGLIGLELWWFLFSKPKAQQATTTTDIQTDVQTDIQEVTVTVDGGYEPSQIVVQAGQPVRLKFNRKDPSSCLEEVRFPDFQIAQDLPLNQITAIEFTAAKPGTYTFTCGMNMFRGTVKVLPSAVPQQQSASRVLA